MQRFENEAANSFATPESISTTIKGVASSIGREKSGKSAVERKDSSLNVPEHTQGNHRSWIKN
jgi:hypothetical protein